jgi:hypothetical protein
LKFIKIKQETKQKRNKKETKRKFAEKKTKQRNKNQKDYKRTQKLKKTTNFSTKQAKQSFNTSSFTIFSHIKQRILFPPYISRQTEYSLSAIPTLSTNNFLTPS